MNIDYTPGYYQLLIDAIKVQLNELSHFHNIKFLNFHSDESYLKGIAESFQADLTDYGIEAPLDIIKTILLELSLTNF